MALRDLAHRLGVAESVTLWGALPRPQVLDKLADCDVLIHPTLHDSGGWVCLEAMAAGRPVICLDLGGPALQVTGETGVKVRANTPNEAVAGLARAILRLAEDAELRVRMSLAARERVKEHFDSVQKGDLMNEIYETTASCR
jgi:glycosyltransferase involved in cell wall biosynthesis